MESIRRKFRSLKSETSSTGDKDFPEENIISPKIFFETLKPEILEQRIRLKEKVKYKLTSIVQNPSNGEIYIGDNQGNIIVMDANS